MTKQIPDLKRRLPLCKRAIRWNQDSSETGREPELPHSFSGCFLLIVTSADKPRWRMVIGPDIQKTARQAGELKRGPSGHRQEWRAGGAPPYSRKLNPRRLLLVPCPQQVLMKIPVTNQTQPKNLDPVFVFFWGTTISIFDFW